tara:strand:+ start:111 stop:905 length:795 start_codon:yes stop_codon:yes gene_type:complete
MNRIDRCFERLKHESKKGFIAYIGAGDPDLESTKNITLELAQSGVDIIELGVPFSDPIADGLVNQLAAQRGLQSGTTTEGVLETVKAIREESDIPIVLYIYYNLIHRRGLEDFIRTAAKSGVDGLLTLDLPPEEADNYELIMAQSGMNSIWLIAPTTPEERIKIIAERGSGFIYYVSREGVTGMRQDVVTQLKDRVDIIRKYTNLPIAVGFGISTPPQIHQVSADCDAVVVGSAIVDRIRKGSNNPSLASEIGNFTKELSSGLK